MLIIALILAFPESRFQKLLLLAIRVGSLKKNVARAVCEIRLK